MIRNRIVPMEIIHLNRVLEIEQASFLDPWTKGSFINEITGNPYAVYFVALEGELVTAYIGGWLVTDELHIINLAVDKNYRQRSIASALIDKILTFSYNKGIQSATLEVRLSNNPAINLYKKKGFIPVGCRPGYYSNNNEDALIMWRKY